ncbi:MAG: hypothetical protein KIT57_09505, partial [Blastocatellales bacterium]|nr:hypothetical protein [Blastocatellales bacterium]
QAPKSLTVEAGRQSEFNFLAYARTAGRTLTSVQVTGAVFATVASLGNDRYVLRLGPEATVTGTFTLELRATDSAGEMTSQIVLLEVKAAEQDVPVAFSQSIETNEDQNVSVTLTGTGGNLFRIISDPRRGRLTGAVPNLIYTPEGDFNGTDAFSFVVGNGTAESAPAVVTINVRPLSDAPILTVGDRFTTNIGQRLAIVINGYDGDAEQELTLSGTGLPAGALIRQTTATSWILEWRPTSEQIGTYVVNLILSDNGAPVQSVSKSITIVVDATWAQTSGPEGGRILSFAVKGKALFAGTDGGVYRTSDNGANWTLANTGITRQKILSLMAISSDLYAGTDLGLFRSTNSGDTWTAVNTGLTDQYVVSLGVSPDGTTVFAGTSNGVHRSTNNGGNWTKVTSGLPDRVTALTFTISGTKLLAGTVYGFYVSEDNGATWGGSSTGLLNLQISGLVVQGERVIAGTRSAGVFVSQLE